MRVAVIGSRNINVNIKEYIPDSTSSIISGGATGVDLCAQKYAKDNNIPFILIEPDYKTYGKSAPIRRNDKIIEMADMVVALWDGSSKGTKYVVSKCIRLGKKVKIHLIK